MKNSTVRLAKPQTQPPPGHLKTAGREHWQSVLAMFTFSEHDLPMLQSACEQLDRAAEARAIIDRDGVTIKDRFGVTKEHPAVAIERNAHLAFVRIERELALQTPAPDTRSPLGRNYR